MRTQHPTTYTITREEWSDINRTLAGAALAFSGCWQSPPNSPERMKDNGERLDRVRESQAILSASYVRARQVARGM